MKLFPITSLVHNTTIALIVKFIVVLACAVFVVIGNYNQNCNLVYMGVLFLFVFFEAYFFSNIKEDVIIALFNLSLFIFLLGRYLVRMIGGALMDASPEYTIMALNLVFVSLLSVNVVYVFLKRKKPKQNPDVSVKVGYTWFIDRIGLFANVGLCISIVCSFVVGIATYRYVLQNGYNSLYFNLTLPIPSFVKVIADMLPFFVALCLARLPRKRISYAILFSYLLMQLPLLVVGRRMPFMIAILVWVSYVVLREYSTPKGCKWIGKAEKITIVIMLPLIIIAVPFIGDIRGGNSTQGGNALERTLDSQGITLDVVSFGIRFQDVTPKSIYGTYTFAPIVDYYSTNFISRKILNSSKISPQTKESAESGTSYADAISYMTLRKDLYLSGQGLGSSYIIETYIDFGMVGLVLYSVLIAVLIYWMSNHFGKSQLKTFFIILLIMELYALPRNSAFGFVVSVLQIQTIFLFGLAFLYNKLSYDRRNMSS